MRIGRVWVGMTMVLMGLPGCSMFGNYPEVSPPTRRGAPPAAKRPAALAETRLCVVDASAPAGLRSVSALKDRRTGQVYIARKGRNRPLSEVYPAKRSRGYAKSEKWFRENGPIEVHGARYEKYGPERVIPASKLKRGSLFAGIPLFLDPRDQRPPSVVYVPSRPGCVFQPYVRESYARRG